MKYLIIIGIISILVCLISCRKESIGGFTIYTIKKGKHNTLHGLKTLTSDVLLFDAVFDESAQYKSKLPENQLDINKLYGFSECNQTHHKNSARFGWRWYNNEVQIIAYVYNDGIRTNEYITSVDINKSYEYKISILDDSYLFSVNGVMVNMDRTSECERGLYYKLFPYFGGDETAPHDIKIKIKESKKR